MNDGASMIHTNHSHGHETEPANDTPLPRRPAVGAHTPGEAFVTCASPAPGTLCRPDAIAAGTALPQPEDMPAPEWRIAADLTPYPDALATMAARVAAIRAGTAAELVWLVEHPPLYTAGTSAKAEELTDPARFPTFRAGRGGRWTYHGPGQRVVYVMLDLTRPHGRVPARDVRCFVHGLEEWLIRALDRLYVQGERRAGRVGIWVGSGDREAKIAAIGVRVSRWVSWHGVALNVAPTLEHFTGIIPCGIREHGVTSLAALQRRVSMAQTDAALRAAWGEVFAPPHRVGS